MADVKWIKITTDIFDDNKIVLLEQSKNGDAFIVIWFKLLCLAGRDNNGGILTMNDKIPYTNEMLATIFRKPAKMVSKALAEFEKYGMIQINDDIITIPNWEKHQNVEQLERIKEQARKRQEKFRKKKASHVESENSNVTSDISRNVINNVDVTLRDRDCNAIDKEIEEDIDKDNNLIVSKDTICSTDVQRVIGAWNSLKLDRVVKVTEGTQRHTWLKKRIKDYGIETVLEAIEKVRQSTFLHGNNNKGWTITFDWFLRPNNFPKVLGGNYDDKGGKNNAVMAALESAGQKYREEENEI